MTRVTGLARRILLRYPFRNPRKGGLSWSGEGCGCNELSGRFIVDQITYSAGEISSIELGFEQHCEHQTPALHGAIRWSR